MCDPKARYFKAKTKLSNGIKLLKPLAMQSNITINKALQHSKQKAEIRLANGEKKTNNAKGITPTRHELGFEKAEAIHKTKSKGINPSKERGRQKLEKGNKDSKSKGKA